MKRFFRWIIRPIRRWQCRRDFSVLSKHEQNLFREVGIDPDSLIKRGDL